MARFINFCKANGITTEDFSITDRNRVKRKYKRASYKKETIYRILDSSALAHVAYVIDNTPFAPPQRTGAKATPFIGTVHPPRE